MAENMQIFLCNTEVRIKSNPNFFKEVTNPILLDKGNIPTPDGLLSTFIFGNTSKDRSIKRGYVNLYGYYFQPLIYKIIKKLDRRIDGIISGRLRVSLNKSGEIIEDENGQTGLTFFFNNWDKIKFKKNESNIRNERVDLLNNHKKEEIFTKYWIIIPAMYRDINLQDSESGKVSYHEINSMYSKVIRLVSMMKQDASLTLNATRLSVQTTLVDIYNYFKEKIEKKNGIIRKSLLGKSIDYGSRLVISAPVYNMNSYKESGVDFYHTGIPVASCC